LPAGLSDDTLRKLLIDNPLDTYPRLREDTVGGGDGVRSGETVP
jgi:hypothetical protein